MQTPAPTIQTFRALDKSSEYVVHIHGYFVYPPCYWTAPLLVFFSELPPDMVRQGSQLEGKQHEDMPGQAYGWPAIGISAGFLTSFLSWLDDTVTFGVY